MNSQKHWWLYVLRLEQNKYYVGITSQTPEKRFAEHLHGRKSYWTEKYPPIEIIDKKFLEGLSLKEAKEYENKVVRKYMRVKGVNNVRGGDLLQKDDYIVRFGYLFDRFGWEAVTTVVLLLLVIVLMATKLYKIW